MARSITTIKLFSKNLDRIMLYRGMKNSWLASLIGVSREMVGQWRSGKSYPSVDFIQRIAETLDCLPEELTLPIFSSNMIKLMKKSGFTPVTFARQITEPVEFIEGLLTEESQPPAHDKLEKIASVLRCDNVNDILKPPKYVEKISLNEWARREGIPVTRAKDLFELDILSGAIYNDFCVMIPVDIVAPENSKQLVTLTKKRPLFGNCNWDGFSEKFSKLMSDTGTTNLEIAEAAGVVPTTVSHWRAGVRTPSEKKLLIIAKVLKCSVNDLINTDNREAA